MMRIPRSGLRGSMVATISSRSPTCRAVYRWSAGDGRRKRESVLDNVEPAEGPADDSHDRGTRRSRESRRRRQPPGDEEDVTGSRGSAAAAPPPPPGASAWEDSEWGPADAQPPPEETAWGWGEEAWQAEGTSAAEERGGGERAVPSDDETHRRRRSQPNGTGASGRTAADEAGAYADSDDEDSEAEYDEDEDEDNSASNGASARGRSSYRPGASEPDIALLSPQELDRVLPVVPFSAQASFFNGGAAQAVQRWGASLALTVLLSKAALLAATTLTWPLWWPWAQAATRNYGLRKQAACAGLWRTQILEVEARGRPRPQFSQGVDDEEGRPPPRPRFTTMRTTRIVLGDPGGAQTELVLPHDARYDLVEPGLQAELVVLASSPSFESFKAVKDVYLPECGLWLSEYPYVDRTEFLELSLEIEREAAAGGGGGGGATHTRTAAKVGGITPRRRRRRDGRGSRGRCGAAGKASGQSVDTVVAFM